MRRHSGDHAGILPRIAIVPLFTFRVSGVVGYLDSPPALEDDSAPFVKGTPTDGSQKTVGRRRSLPIRMESTTGRIRRVFDEEEER